MTTEVLTGRHQAGGGVIPFWQAVLEIARKEVLLFVRTKRLYVAGGFLAFALLGLSIFFAYTFTGLLGNEFDFLFSSDGFSISKANVVMAFAIFIPIIGAMTFLNFLGIVFTFDGIVREYEDKTLFLLLSKPVTREAFVLGKFFGAVFTVGAIFMAVGTLAYFIVMLMVGEFASPGDILRYFLALGILLLAMIALASMGLFGSAFSRSTTMSILFSLAMWIIILSLLSNSGLFYAAVTQSLDEEPWYIKATNYLNPSTAGGPAAKVMINFAQMQESGGGFDFPIFLGNFALEPFITVLSLIGFTAFFLGLTTILVNRRNFE